jgi:diguanylate cyclase
VNEIDDKVLSAISVDQPAAVTELHRRIDEIKFLLNDLFQSAAHLENGRDPLTRTLNRRFLPSVLGREISLAKNAKTPLSILMADIDHFKTVNDSHGHSAGDTVLSHTAETLLNCVRASDFVFRYGGEEFLIVLVETDREEAMEVAERIRQQIASQSVPLPSKSSLNVTLSLGVATYEGHPDYQYLINAADHALYSAKKQGRNRTAVAVADNT